MYNNSNNHEVIYIYDENFKNISTTVSFTQGDGDAQELLSDRDGPVRFTTILKTPYAGAYDEFAEERPIIGIVTKKGT